MCDTSSTLLQSDFFLFVLFICEVNVAIVSAISHFSMTFTVRGEVNCNFQRNGPLGKEALVVSG